MTDPISSDAERTNLQDYKFKPGEFIKLGDDAHLSVGQIREDGSVASWDGPAGEFPGFDALGEEE